MPYIVPGPTPAPRTGLGDFSASLGNQMEKYQDFLLAALLSGRMSPKASGGIYSSPTGATTSISPAEQVQGQPGVNLADLIQNRVVPQTQGTSFTPTKYSGFQFNPDMQRILQQAQLTRAQQEISAYPTEQRISEEKLRALQESGPTEKSISEEKLKALQFQNSLQDDIRAGKVTMTQALDGTVFYLYNTPTGPRPLTPPKKTTAELAREMEKDLSGGGNALNVDSLKPSEVLDTDWVKATYEQKVDFLRKRGLRK